MITTRYGIYTQRSKGRLELTYDYEDSTLIAYAKASELLGVNYFFDIGANIGCYSVYLSKVKSIQKIFAFEPAPISFQELNKNIALQRDTDKFVSFNVALSDTKKETTFLVVSEMSGANRIDDGNAGGEYIEVSCEPLDALIQLKDKKAALKIDVEGHELQTIAGMTDFLKNNHCLVQVECLQEELAARVGKILSAHGYVLAFILRDDYLFLSPSLAETKDAIQQIYFRAVQDDLRDLLELRTYKRNTINRAMEMLVKSGYPYEPVCNSPVK